MILRKAALHLSPNGARCTADPTPPEHRLGGADERRLMELITYGLHPADDSRGAI